MVRAAKFRVRFVVLLAVIVSLVGQAHAQTCEDYSRFTHYVTRAPLNAASFLSIDIVGSLAYLGNQENYFGPDFQIIDISDPEDPTLLGTLSTSGTVNDVEVSGNYAYLLGNPFGNPSSTSSSLRIIDVSNSSTPTQTGSVTLPGGSHGSIVVSGNYAYVGNYNAGLVIVDVSSSTAPTVVGQLSFGSPTRDVAVEGHYAYVANDTYVRIVDVQDPSSPTLAGSVNMGYECSGIDVDGAYAYAAMSSMTSGQSGLRVIDVSTPASAAIVGSVPNLAGGTVIVEGGLAYTGTGINGKLAVVDVSTPTSPVLLMTTDIGFPATTGKGVALSGGYVFTAFGDMLVGKIGEFGYPTRVTRYTGDEFVKECTVHGDAGYIIYYKNNASGVRRLDLSDPTHPAPLDYWDLVYTNFTRTLAASDDFLIMTIYGPQGEGFVLFDVSGGGLVHQKTKYIPVWSSSGAAISGNYAYLTGDLGFKVFDLSTPTSPVEVASSEFCETTPGYPVIVGNLLYIPYPLGGLQIVDISVPTSPVLLGTTMTGGPSHGRSVTVQGDIAFVAGFNGDLLSVDVSNPMAPVILDLEKGGGRTVAVDGNTAYLSNNQSQVTLFDISDPSHMLGAGNTFSAGSAENAQLCNGYVVIASDEEGLLIYPQTCAETSVDVTPRSPARFSVRAYPNPFNPRTTVAFDIPGRALCRLAVYDASGRRVAVLANRVFPAGPNAVQWDGRTENGSPAASGVYFVRIVAGELRATTKLVLLK